MHTHNAVLKTTEEKLGRIFVHVRFKKNINKRHTKSSLEFILTVRNYWCFSWWADNRWWIPINSHNIKRLCVCVCVCVSGAWQRCKQIPPVQLTGWVVVCVCVCVCFRGWSVIFSVCTEIWIWKALTSYRFPLMTHERCSETQTYINISHILQYWRGQRSWLHRQHPQGRLWWEKWARQEFKPRLHDVGIRRQSTRRYSKCFLSRDQKSIIRLLFA